MRLTEQGIACFEAGKTYRRLRTCTPGPVPTADTELDAKRFEPSDGKFTLYVVRQRWADAANLVSLKVDRSEVATVPRSVVRMRLQPGSHEMVATWPEGRTAIEINGAAGQVAFVELVGSIWFWGSQYRLERGDPESSRTRASRLRLVADVG